MARYNKEYSKYGHDCELQAELDLFERIFPGTGNTIKLKRWWSKLTAANEKICKASAATIHLRSHGAIVQEIERHLLDFRSVFHPFSKFKLVWECFMIVVFFCNMTSVSYDVAYFSFSQSCPFFSSTVFVLFRTILDIFCCMDMVVKSCTGYYYDLEKQIVLKHSRIVLHYLKTDFFFDFISSMPTHWDLIFKFNRDFENDLPLQILQIFSLFKLLKIFSVITYTKNISDILHISYYNRQGLIMTIIVIQYWNAMACIRVFTYVLFDDYKNIFSYTNKTFYEAWTRTMYEGAQITYTSGYGVLVPDTTLDYIILNIFWIISKYIQINILGTLMSFLRVKNSPRIKNAEMIHQVVEFMRHKQLPLYTQSRILAYYDFSYQESYFRESEIYRTISGQLRQEIVMQTCKQLVESVIFFQELPMNLLVRIVTCMKSEVFMKNDVVVKSGSPGDSMYFIHSGTVAVYTSSGKEICHLIDGAHFGEISLVNVQAERVATVIAIEVCELYKLDKQDFARVIEPYPDMLEKIQTVATERMEMTEMYDQHIRERKDAETPDNRSDMGPRLSIIETPSIGIIKKPSANVKMPR